MRPAYIRWGLLTRLNFHRLLNKFIWRSTSLQRSLKNFGDKSHRKRTRQADFASMLWKDHMVDYREQAEECRRLAKLRAGSEHWAVFLEMAETWGCL
jgi:hypothetical protein